MLRNYICATNQIGTKKERVPNPLYSLCEKNKYILMTVKGNHSLHTFIISQFSSCATSHVPLKLVSYFILILIRLCLIMSVTKNKGCGVALLNKLRHSPCLKIISVIFCNNACQVALWQLNHWHIPAWLLVSFYAKNKDKNPSHI